MKPVFQNGQIKVLVLLDITFWMDDFLVKTKCFMTVRPGLVVDQ